MNVNIRDADKLKKIAEEFQEKPENIINYMLDSFNEHQFLEVARKSSLKTALYRHSGNLMIVKGLEFEIYEILGAYDYHIEDCGFDFEKKTFWFLMYVSGDEKKIDIDEIHFQINEGSSTQLSVKKYVEGISDWDKLESAKQIVIEEMENHFTDAEHVDVEFHDELLDQEEDDSIAIEIAIGDYDLAYIPKLDECDRVLVEIEHKFRKALE